VTHSNLAIPLVFNNAKKVFFAGEATTDEYFSTVHGAMQSGKNAALAIAKLAGPVGPVGPVGRKIGARN
jgi:hypothetical protein